MKFLFVPILLFFSVTKAQVVITPRLGLEYFGISYYPGQAVKRNDIKISVPDKNIFLSGEIGIIKGGSRISISYEMKNLGEGMGVINDSTVSPTGRVFSGKSILQVSGTISYVGLYYDRFSVLNKNFPRFKWYYGAGLGIGFNRTDAYYLENQDAGYSSFNYGDVQWQSYGQMWNKPTGNGIFLKIRSGLAYANKRKREILLLDIYWNQGFKKMLEHTVNYGYGIPGNAGSWHHVTGHRYNNRGTTFGATLGFPIYLFKKGFSK